MPLPTDPDTLRVPAFMRKRNLRTRDKRQPLLLTAYDRKKAGVLPEPLEKKKIARKNRVKKREKPLMNSYELPLFAAPVEKAKKARPAKIKTRIKKKPTYTIPAVESFSPPLVDFYKANVIQKKTHTSSKRSKKQPRIGTITHYYGKIRVAVIAVETSLSVGDYITYQTPNGSYSQVIESMEINRRPVFSAQRGDDVGIKIANEPVVGCNVIQ